MSETAEKIKQMLSEGKSPKEIKQTLNIKSLSYIYKIKRKLANTPKTEEFKNIEQIVEKPKETIETKAENIEPKLSDIKVSEIDEKRESVITPIESINSEIERIVLEDAKAQILKRLKNVDPSIFEKIVGQLLEKLGYGRFADGTIKVIGRSHDGGIDGICSLDKLGLVKVIFQAKRWEANVGIDEVARLIGTLHNRVSIGILITTADFTADAKREAERAGNIRLINGEELVSLMIQTGLGIKKVSVYYPKIDEDYFNDLEQSNI